MKKKYFIIILAAVTVLFHSCSTIDEGEGFPSNLLGIIFDDYNNPVDGAKIRLSEEHTLTSDIDGRFLLPQLMNSAHSIIISKPGFETQQLDFDFFDPKQILYVKLSSIDYLKEEIEKQLYTKKYDAALPLIKRAMTVDEADPVLLYLCAIYYIKTDEPAAAMDCINSLSDLGYESAGVEKLLRQLDSK